MMNLEMKKTIILKTESEKNLKQKQRKEGHTKTKNF